MGEVYLAERCDDTQQRVALKLIRLDAIDNAAHFVRERRILARLQHPHIAHLIDAGVTENGRPWFAMERVEGERITRWCDARKLDLRQRVRLFLPVCAAVHYAHVNLVLHRDLKPSNILVNAAGEPKLLDFGIAKLIDDTDPQARQQTQTVAFTPAYAAPEQLRGERATTASDTCQLGLVLFELCSGVAARAPGSSEISVPHPSQALARQEPEVSDRLAQLQEARLQSEAAPMAELHDTRLALARLLTEARQFPQAEQKIAQLDADPVYSTRDDARLALLDLRGRWQFLKGDFQAAREVQDQALTIRKA